MVDTESPAYKSWLETYEEYGCEFPFSLWSVVLGGSGKEFDPIAYLEQQVGRSLDHEVVGAKRWQRKLDLIAAQPLSPGILDYIESARQLGLKLGVASSSSRKWVVGHLDRLGVTAAFEVIVCRDDVTHVKPDPEIYLTALAKLRLGPQEAIAFEDAPNGLLAAKRAGLFCVAVPNSITGQLPLENMDLRLISLTELSLQELIVLAQNSKENKEQQSSAPASSAG